MSQTSTGSFSARRAAHSAVFTPRAALFAVLVATSGAIVYLVAQPPPAPRLAAAAPVRNLDEIPFDGRQAYAYLEQLCALGPRPSGSPAMLAQQKLLTAHFEKLGCMLERQEFVARDPRNGGPVPMTNLILRWRPELKERILLCAHYDTRPFPDRDPRNPRGVFVGANDGASGTAILMELGKQLPKLEGRLGVDIALFDGEEYVFDENHPYLLGSTEFARRYRTAGGPERYRWGVLLDMVGDSDLQVFQEVGSVTWPDTRPLVAQLWAKARELGVRQFIDRPKFEIQDDHVPLRNEGGIPTCDIIDFDYPHWHTERDTAERCSPLSLARVGWVVHEWLKDAVRE